MMSKSGAQMAKGLDEDPLGFSSARYQAQDSRLPNLFILSYFSHVLLRIPSQAYPKIRRLENNEWMHQRLPVPRKVKS